MISVFTAAAGRTAPTNIAKKVPLPKPANNATTPTNTEPLMTVPMKVKIGALIALRTFFCSSTKRAKTINADKGLSIMFAICPPGACVVKAEITPDTNANNKTYLALGNRNTPKNIMDNNISGLTPKTNPGTTACNTVPIPTKSDKVIKMRIFILTSPHLCFSKLLPTVHSLSVAETYSYYNKNRNK